MESEIIAEFIRITSAKPNDAVSCLRAFEFDLKKALIDYNGKCKLVLFSS